MLLPPFRYLVLLLISTTTTAADVSVDSRTFFTCYDSKGWCKADCSLPCFSVDRCNGSNHAMYTCPSVGLLVLVVIAIVLIIALLICCISCCCCPCCLCAKCMKQRAARKRKEEFLTADVRRYERHGNVNDGYDNYPTARIVEVTRTPIYNETDKPASSTSHGMKKHRQKADIVHMRQREFDDTDIINGFEQRRVWNTGEERRGRREPLPEHGLQYEESYRNHHDYPIVPEPDYPTGTDQRRVQLVSTARRHNDNATSLYKIRGTQTSAASLDDNLEGSETRDDGASKRLSI